MNEEDNLSEEGLEDPYESALKKAKEAEKKRIEAQKDDLTEGKIKRKRTGEEDIEEGGGFLDPESGFRTTLAIGTEVLGNTLLDLLSADPTQLSQVFGAQGINYFAQRIRGGEFSEGEMIASGLASLLPGGAQARSVAGVIGKTAARGAVSGAIETGAADLIDTGEIDPDNVLAGAGVGGAFGGILGSAATTKQGRNLIKKLQARLRGGDFVPMDDTIDLAEGTIGAAKVKKLDPNVFIDPIEGDEFGRYLDDQEVFKSIRRWRSYRPPAEEVNRVRKTLLKFGMVGNRFDMNIYKKAVKRDPVTKVKRFSANDERNLISIFVTAPITKVDYNKVSKRVMPQFRRQYKPMLDALGIPASELQLHHLMPLKASLPLYHGLVYDSDEWWELTAFLLKRHIKAGDSETNLRKLIGAGKRSVQDETAPLANKDRPLKTPHSISHQHVRDEFGEDGSKFFTQDILDSIENDQAERIRIADIYTRKLRRNFDLTNQAQKVYEITFDPKNKYAMEDIVSVMTRMDEGGYLDTTNKKYQVDILNDMIRGIEEAGGGNQYLRNRDIITEKEYNLRQASLKEQRESFNESIDYAQEYAEDVAERAKKRENIFTRYSTLEDAIDEAERILQRDRLFYSDPALPGIQNYEQTVLRLARLLMENPNYIP